MLIALFPTTNAVILIVFQSGFWNANQFMQNLVHGRLQRNLLRAILSDRPQRGGPSPGEILNRF